MKLRLCLYETHHGVRTTLAVLTDRPTPTSFTGQVAIPGKVTHAALIKILINPVRRDEIWGGTVGNLGHPDADILLSIVQFHGMMNLDIEMDHIMHKIGLTGRPPFAKGGVVKGNHPFPVNAPNFGGTPEHVIPKSKGQIAEEEALRKLDEQGFISHRVFPAPCGFDLADPACKESLAELARPDTCTECNGTGEIVLFSSTVPCDACKGGSQ